MHMLITEQIFIFISKHRFPSIKYQYCNYLWNYLYLLFIKKCTFIKHNSYTLVDYFHNNRSKLK